MTIQPVPWQARRPDRRRTTVHESSPRTQRVLHTLAAIAYLVLFIRIYDTYISVVWGYLGMSPLAYAAWEWIFILVQVASVAAALPIRLGRPSAIVVWLLFAFVYVPTIAMTTQLGWHRPAHYVPLLLMLSVIFIAMSAASQWPLKAKIAGSGLTRPVVDIAFLAAWAAASVLLLVYFRDILSFSSIDDIYYQRALASDLGGGVLSYVQTYYTYVITPAVLAIGLMKRKWLHLACGFAGFLITYAIDAQKLSLVVPFVMVAIYLSFRFRRTSLMFYTGGLTVIVAACSLLESTTVVTKMIINVVIFRAIAVPGQVMSQYYDLFSAKGFTWWSNTRGVSSFVPPPDAFSNDPNWPSLGRIVGNENYGHLITGVNANANAFAGEGAAAGGLVGLAIIGLAMAAWLRVIDLAAARWNLPFVTLVMLPVALCLSNVHLTTVLVSFGGGFWILLMALDRPQGAPAPRSSRG
jgi:hypothetical protein